MAGYNQTRYNIDPFNRSSSGKIWAKTLGYELISSFVAISIEVWVSATAREDIAQAVNGNRGIFVKGRGTENVAAYADGVIYFLAHCNGKEIIGSQSAICSYIYPIMFGSEIIRQYVNMFVDIYPDVLGTEEISGHHHLAMIAYDGTNGGERVSSIISVEAIEEIICYFKDLIMEPGDILVIDADTYNVYLNGENAIHLQSGEWIDELVRETQKLQVQADQRQQNLTVTVLTTERYL